MKQKNIDIHNYKGRYETTIRRLQNDDGISQKNKELILNYVIEKKNKGIIGLPRACKIIETLKIVTKIINKDIDKITLADKNKFLEEMDKRDYKDWTKNDYKVVFKTFLREKFPKKTNIYDFRANLRRKDRPKPIKSELLTPEEINKLLNACESMRDKAIVSLLWESGARISEIGNMMIKNVNFEDDCTTINLAKGKTGTRTIFVVESTQYLAMWIKQHPLNNKTDSPLWVNMGRHKKTKYQAICYRCFYKNLKEIFTRAGITKKFNPHMFRHSRATFLATKGWSQQQLNKFFGWSPDSDMAGVYISMCDEDIKNGVRELYGLKKKETTEEKRLKICPRCEAPNESNTRYCFRCGMILDRETAIKMKKINQVTDDLNEGYLTKKDPNTSMKEYVDGYVEKLVKQRIKELTTK